MKYLLFYFIFPFLSQSQTGDPALAEQLFYNKTIVWQKQYVGYWDDVIPVRLELASDGEFCKGFLYFGTDIKNKYVVTGKQLPTGLELEEQDLKGKSTGLLALQIQGNSIKGTWYNSSMTFNAPMHLQEGNSKLSTNYWVRSYASKIDPSEAQLLLQKDFADQIITKFYYKLLNKTLNGTSAIKQEEVFQQESQLTDYLQNAAGKLHTYRTSDKKLDINYQLGHIEYNQSLELTNEIEIIQEVFADHWIAVDIAYPKVDKGNISVWTRNLVDSFINIVQEQKQFSIDAERDQDDRLLHRLSIWPQFDFLNEQITSGVLHVKSSWTEDMATIPFVFDLNKGEALDLNHLVQDKAAFESIKNRILSKELSKLQSSSALDYSSLHPEYFTIMTLKKEGLVFSAPYDLVNGFRQIVIPFFEIRQTLSPKYFPF